MNPWLCAGTPPGVALLSLAGLSPEFGKNAFLWAYESSGQQVEATRKRKWGGDRVGIGEKEGKGVRGAGEGEEEVEQVKQEKGWPSR